jgi:N-methylhydantoinase A
VTERVAADGEVLEELDETDALRVIDELVRDGIEAVGVCFLWSIVNPRHEQRFGELLVELAPHITQTLSHELNPTVREYRRASSVCIDASLKPLISTYLADLEKQLHDEGFRGRLLMVTSAGGVAEFRQVIEAPIHSLRSGPAMAPVAGRWYAHQEAEWENTIVADAGGTSYDVSLVKRDQIPWARDAWIGEEFAGHIIGFPAIDVKSIGAGGGSIAWVDDGGLLHVGPESAGSDPGPACYGRGGSRATVSDACLVLGYLDSASFLGGRMPLDRAAAERAVREAVAAPLGLGVEEGAAAIVDVMTEEMVQAIEEVTVRQGIAPDRAVLVAGGGSAGFNAVAIARRLGCPLVIIPEVAAGLSAAGALLSDLVYETQITRPVSTARFDMATINAVLAELRSRCSAFVSGARPAAGSSTVEFFAEARYPDQVWEIEVPLRSPVFAGAADVDAFRADFHGVHRELFAVADNSSQVEVVAWRARARCRLRDHAAPSAAASAAPSTEIGRRRAYFGNKQLDCDVHIFAGVDARKKMRGPAVIESPSTTVVLPPGAEAVRSPQGSLRITPLVPSSDS